MNTPHPAKTNVSVQDIVELYNSFFKSIMRNHKKEEFADLFESLKNAPREVLVSECGYDVAILSDELIVHKNADTGISEMVYTFEGDTAGISSDAVDWVMELWFPKNGN